SLRCVNETRGIVALFHCPNVSIPVGAPCWRLNRQRTKPVFHLRQRNGKPTFERDKRPRSDHRRRRVTVDLETLSPDRRGVCSQKQREDKPEDYGDGASRTEAAIVMDRTQTDTPCNRM